MSDMVLQEGSIGDLPLLDLIVLARGMRGPAILELRRAGVTRRMFFRDGLLAAFTSDGGKESFGEFLRRRGRLAADRVGPVEEAAAREGLTPAQVLLRDRLLPTPDVASELSAWASLLVVQSFGWDSGEFRIVAELRGAAPPETLLEVDLPVLLAQGVWKRMDVAAIRALVEPLLGLRAQAKAELPWKPSAFKAGPESLRAWEGLRATDSVAQVLADMDPDEGARALYLFHRVGMLDLAPAVRRDGPLGRDLDSFLDGLDDLDDLGGDFGEDAPTADDDSDDLLATLRDLPPARRASGSVPTGATPPPAAPRGFAPPPAPPRGFTPPPAPPKGFTPPPAPPRGPGAAPGATAAPPRVAPPGAATGGAATPPPPRAQTGAIVTPPPPPPDTPPPRPPSGARSATPPARGAGAPADLGVDLSSIGFRRGGGGAQRSGTFHTTGGIREELATGSHRPADASGEVQIPVASTREAPQNAAESSPLAGLFDDIGRGKSAAPRAPVTPPRHGRAGWKPGEAPSPPPPASPRAPEAVEAPAPRPPDAADAPPPGPGPAIDAAEWANLRTQEKDRVRGLRTILGELDGQNYFEMFELSHEASDALIKKAYFKLARRYHPDALVDEGPVYTRLAEAIFAKISEAYDVLTDAERRDAYTRKVIFGEKDENELAMEKVQTILAAEGAFKTGVRLLNQGKLGVAVEKLQEAVDGYPDEPEYRGWLGYALFRANQRADYERALAGEQMLLEAIAAKPANHELPHLMGKIAMQRKDFVEAKKWLRKSLKMQPDNPEALREYKRADDGTGGGAAADEEPGGLKGLFGRLGKK